MEKLIKLNKLSLHLLALGLGFSSGLVFRDFFINHPLKKARMAFADYYGGSKKLPKEIDRLTNKRFFFEKSKKYKN